MLASSDKASAKMHFQCRRSPFRNTGFFRAPTIGIHHGDVQAYLNEASTGGATRSTPSAHCSASRAPSFTREVADVAVAG